MGWMSQRQPPDLHVVKTETRKPVNTKVESYAEHAELIERTESTTFQKWRMQDPSVLDNDLPFIPPDLVRKQRLGNNQGPIWLVVDSIVYDCTNFIAEHPGGETVIRSFISEDCSWQFWRFHSPSTMEEFGRPLRVGRTEGIRNRFEEPPRYVGLSRLG